LKKCQYLIIKSISRKTFLHENFFLVFSLKSFDAIDTLKICKRLHDLFFQKTFGNFL